MAGGPSLLSWGPLYAGVHLNLAFGLALEGGTAFIQVPVLVALLAAPSSFIIYEVATKIYGGRREGLLAQLLYVVTGFVWFVPIYGTGLYPNLYGIILSLAYLSEVVRVYSDRSKGAFVAVILLSAGLYLAHYSVVLFIAAIDVVLLAMLVAKKLPGRLTFGIVLVNLLPSLGLVFRPNLLSVAYQVLGSTAYPGFFKYSTPVSDLLSFSPFLRYLTAEVYNYGGLLLMFATLPLAFYYAWGKRKESPFLGAICIWFALIWVVSPQGELAWRFSNQALTPLVLLAPASFFLISRLLTNRFSGSRAQRRQKERRTKELRQMPGGKTFEIAAVAVMTFVVFSGSWTYIMLTDVSTLVPDYPQASQELYNSMLWFKANTPAQSVLLSVTDWRATYLAQLTGHASKLLLFADEPSAVSYAKSNGIHYILLTYLVPTAVPTGFDPGSFYSAYQSSGDLKQVYNSTYDVIYEVIF
jgi:hypothetical protein